MSQPSNSSHIKEFGSLLRSILHNIFVVLVGLGLAFLCTKLDSALNIHAFKSLPSMVAGLILIAAGFLLRVWAAYCFYQHQMKVISLSPQSSLITSGPYAFSRNPLYLGGNVFIFFGAALLEGSPTMVVFTAIHLPFVDMFIRREEKQLEQSFGNDWLRYTKQVRRWI